MQVQVVRMQNRYVAPAATDDLRARLDEVAVGPLGAALDALLPGVLSSLGIDPASEVLVRRVNLRVRVLDDEVASEELAAAWARAVAEALARILAPLAGRALGATELAAIFPDRPTAEWIALSGRATGRAEAWWWPVVLAPPGAGFNAVPRPPESVLRSWLAQAPRRFPRLVASLAQAAPGALTGLTPQQARLLLRDLVASWRPGEVAAPLPPTWTPSPDLAPTPVQPQRAALLATLPHPELQALVAACLAWAEDPTQPWRPELVTAHLAAARQATAARPHPAAVPRQREADAHVPVPVDETHTAEITAGGLLLLLAPLRRLEAVGSAEERLHLARTLLHHALAPLHEAALHAAFLREAPLLQAFTGLPELPTDLHLPFEAPAAIAALCQALADLLPPDLDPMPGAIRAAFGRSSVEHPWPQWAALLLRPGCLRLSPTLAELTWPLEAADVRLRLLGWDLDPGWVPELGREVRFRFESRP